MNQNIGRTLLIALLGACIIGCSPSAKSATVDDLVAEMVKRAAAEDTRFFTGYMDASAKGEAPRLIQQIKASEMATNYTNRLETVSETKVRLNYHYLEKGCHFQVDLEQRDGLWTIRRIWFCR